jgi:hypothetical protein
MAEMQQMQASLQQLLTQMGDLNVRLQTTEQRATAAETRATLAEQTATAQARPVEASRPRSDPYTAWASKYQPEVFLGGEAEWSDWARIFRAWAGRFDDGQMGVFMTQAAASQVSCKVVARDGLADNSKNCAAELFHMLITFVRGKALTLVLKAGEQEGLEAWRLLVHRYEPSDNASSVGKLVALLSRDFEGDLIDELTKFESQVATWEREAGELISDKLKIGVVVKGLPKGSLKEHMLLAASKAKSYAEFVRELEAIELAKNSLKNTAQPMSIDNVDNSFKGKCSYCKREGHKEVDCRKKKADKAAGQVQAPKCSNCGKPGHQAKDCWSKPAGSQAPGGGPKGGKKGGGKGKKGGKKGGKGGFHECEEEEEAWGYEEEWPAEAAEAAAAGAGAGFEALGGLSLCALALEPLTAGVRDDPEGRTLTLGVDSAACRTVVSPKHPATRGYKTHVDAHTGTEYSTAGTATVEDKGRRVLCADNPEGPDPLVLDTRSAETRRPLASVKELTNKGGWVVFGPQQGFLYRPQTQQTHKFTNTPHGWNWVIKLDPPNKAGKRVAEAIEATQIEKNLPTSLGGADGLPPGVPEAVRRAISGQPFLGQTFRP